MCEGMQAHPGHTLMRELPTCGSSQVALPPCLPGTASSSEKVSRGHGTPLLVPSESPFSFILPLGESD